MLAKLTYEFVKEQFEKEGYKLLSEEYVDSKTKLKYECPEGHKHSISWNNWRQGQRCFYCSNNAKPSIEFIRQYFENKGCVLLTEVYINAQQKLEYICANGHRHEIKWNHFKDGSRCPICYFIRISGPNNHNWKGGISCEPYCGVWLDKEFKESILERDNHQCQNPDCWGTSERLTIHHIDYNKKNCGPENLITLCRSCNTRASKDREWYTDYYNSIMELRNLVIREKFLCVEDNEEKYLYLEKNDGV